jgi:thioredoxin-like negative regulator of GroEL
MVRLTRMNSKLVLVSLLLLVDAGCAPNASHPSGTQSARQAFERGDDLTARRLASAIRADEPNWAEGQMVLAAIALRSGNASAAMEHYRAIPRDGSAASLAAARAAVELEQASGHLHDAIRSCNYILAQDPRDRATRRILANLYAATGQRRLADTELGLLIRLPGFDFKQLVLLTDFERLDPHNLDFLQHCESTAPDDPAVNLGLAVEEVAKGNLTSARRRLIAAVHADPELAAAQALVGELLLDEGDAALQQWYDALPGSIHDDAGIWFVRGRWAQRRSEQEIAARCFWEAARQMPTSHRALHQLALAVTPLQPETGQVFTERAQALYDFRQHLSRSLNSRGGDEPSLRQVIAHLMESGREWEAWSWLNVAHELYPMSPWVAQAARRVSQYPKTDAPRIVDSKNLFLTYDLSHYPPFRSSNDSRLASEVASGMPQIQFVDQASSAGLEFSYHHGRTENVAGVRMQESTGGGIGVLDYDRDGLPDLFFTQGEDWPNDSDVPAPSEQYRDQLFRNVRSRFQNVTVSARIPSESGFGQGCSAGDFNNDGFPDLYVANIGVNQLLINNGDGTFSDQTSTLNLTTQAWTTSCLVADLNADGNPDLFDVNYVEGELLYRKICDEHSCTPQAHRSAKDHLYLSQGDGTVRLVDFGGEERWGAGLGIVAFSMDVSPAEGPADATANFSAGRLSLFIANDHEPNFFLVNTPAGNPENLTLTDAAFVRGLAVNKDGKPTACMGVASGDLNADGLIDLFVTNYKDEANNLYLQSSGGYFTDAIVGTGLLAAGIPYVGWGTQCLDADNDGRLDLVVANGHVGDFRKPGLECYMPTQFFHNTGRTWFEELAPKALGSFFARKLLGRSIATIDWNLDGLTDFVLSPIAAPVALLTNRTAGAGHFLAIRLHGVSVDRDAIGTVVTVVSDEGNIRQQLTAGDGYQVTNERILRFGLGSQMTVRKVVVQWTSGVTDTIEDIPANQIVDVVEGRGHSVQRSPSGP